MSDATNSIFSLPKELLSVILGFCDGLSISTASVAFLGSEEQRSLTFSVIDVELQSRINSLQKRGGLPQGDKIWEDILSTKSIIQLLDTRADERSSKPSNLLQSFSDLLTGIAQMSDRLAILSFFEDVRYQVKTDRGVELPIWCGRISMNCPDVSESTFSVRIETARATATTPITTWNHRLIRDWKRFGCVPPLLKPTIRRALPLPPVVRMTGTTVEDAAILSTMANLLDERNEVVRLECHQKTLVSAVMSTGVIFMSRKQALRRWSSQTFFPSRPKDMWPLDYKCEPMAERLNPEFQSGVDSRSTSFFRVQSFGENVDVETGDLFGFIQNAQFELESSQDMRREAVDDLIQLMKSAANEGKAHV